MLIGLYEAKVVLLQHTAFKYRAINQLFFSLSIGSTSATEELQRINFPIFTSWERRLLIGHLESWWNISVTNTKNIKRSLTCAGLRRSLAFSMKNGCLRMHYPNTITLHSCQHKNSDYKCYNTTYILLLFIDWSKQRSKYLFTYTNNNSPLLAGSNFRFPAVMEHFSDVSLKRLELHTDTRQIFIF